MNDSGPSTRHFCPCCAHCNPCACLEFCGDSDPDGPGICCDLPRAAEPTLLEVVLVRRDQEHER